MKKNANIENAALKNKANAMFDDLDLDDEFSDGQDGDNKM